MQALYNGPSAQGYGACNVSVIPGISHSNIRPTVRGEQKTAGISTRALHLLHMEPQPYALNVELQNLIAAATSHSSSFLPIFIVHEAQILLIVSSLVVISVVLYTPHLTVSCSPACCNDDGNSADCVTDKQGMVMGKAMVMEVAV